MEISNQKISKLIDKQEIYEVVVRFLRCLDRADIEGLRHCYHPEATYDHGGLSQGLAQIQVDQLAPKLLADTLVTHFTTNVLIDLKDEYTAQAESYMFTFSRLTKDGEEFDCLSCTRFIDLFKKISGEWKISHRKLVFEWNHDMEMRDGWGRGMAVSDPSVITRGKKNMDDVVYDFFRS